MPLESGVLRMTDLGMRYLSITVFANRPHPYHLHSFNFNDDSCVTTGHLTEEDALAAHDELVSKYS